MQTLKQLCKENLRELMQHDNLVKYLMAHKEIRLFAILGRKSGQYGDTIKLLAVDNSGIAYIVTSKYFSDPIPQANVFDIVEIGKAATITRELLPLKENSKAGRPPTCTKTIKAILRRRKAGDSIRTIARRCHASTTTVQKILKEYSTQQERKEKSLQVASKT